MHVPKHKSIFTNTINAIRCYKIPMNTVKLKPGLASRTHLVRMRTFPLYATQKFQPFYSRDESKYSLASDDFLVDTKSVPFATQFQLKFFFSFPTRFQHSQNLSEKIYLNLCKSLIRSTNHIIV